MILHPTNQVWPGSPNHPMPTLEQAYADGYSSGKGWPRDKEGWRYVPGGPWVHSGYAPGMQALVDHSNRVSMAWRSGWNDGFRSNGAVPEWFR